MRRLAVWAEGTTGGVALVRYDSEPARHAAVDRLIGELERRGIPVAARDLSPLATAERVDALAECVAEVPPHTVLVVSGLAQTPADEAEARARLGPWNFARERLAVPTLAQVWWMPRPVADAFARVAPDLFSWLLLRLDLTESPAGATAPAREDAPVRFGDAAAARATAVRLEVRFSRLPEDDRRGVAGIEAALRMVEVLDGAGLFTEASGLLIRLAQANGFADAAAWAEAAGAGDPLRRAGWLHELANHSVSMGDLDAAERRVRQELELRTANGANEGHILASLNNLGHILLETGRVKEARELYTETVVRGRANLGERDPDLLTMMGNLSSALFTLGEFEQARTLDEEILATKRSVLGDDHPDTLTSMNNLAGNLRALGRSEEAGALRREAVATSRRALGDRHPRTLSFLTNHAAGLLNMGLLEEARSLAYEALAGCQAVLGPDHPDTLRAVGGLGCCLFALGQHEQAVSLLETAASRAAQALDPEHPVAREIEGYIQDARATLLATPS